jgi:hypothetical protein
MDEALLRTFDKAVEAGICNWFDRERGLIMWQGKVRKLSGRTLPVPPVDNEYGKLAEAYTKTDKLLRKNLRAIARINKQLALDLWGARESEKETAEVLQKHGINL